MHDLEARLEKGKALVCLVSHCFYAFFLFAPEQSGKAAFNNLASLHLFWNLFNMN